MRRGLLCSLVLAMAAVLCSATAHAVIISETQTFVIPSASTPWSGNIEVGLFDSTKGILQSIEFDLTGFVSGTARYENLTEGQGGDLTLNLSGQLTLKRPDNSVIVISIPVASIQDTATGFDGTMNYGGDSGSTFSNLSNSLLQSATLTNASDLALFSGLGNLFLPLVASSSSGYTVDGSLDILTQFATLAGANILVTYNYESTVPEPATVLLLGSGLVGLVGLSRRRKCLDS